MTTDDTPPGVLTTSPTDQATGVPVDTGIRVTFSEPISPGSLDNASFTVVDANGTSVNGLSSDIANFFPLSVLLKNTTYTITLTTAIQDLAGNPMSSDLTRIFTTESVASGTEGPTITVLPVDPTIPAGAALLFGAEVRDSGGVEITGAQVSWSVSEQTPINPNQSSFLRVASINSNGVASGLTGGTASIQASVGALTGSSTLTVTAPPVASMTITPVSKILLVGRKIFLSARPVDTAGNPVFFSPVTWSSSNTAVASVDAFGFVTALGAGTATITASDSANPAINATVTITVNNPLLSITLAGSGIGTVTSDPPGINCGADCTENFASGTVVTLTATPDAGSSFEGFSGNADCVDGLIAMTADRNCTATFTGTGGGPPQGSPPRPSRWGVSTPALFY